MTSLGLVGTCKACKVKNNNKNVKICLLFPDPEKEHLKTESSSEQSINRAKQRSFHVKVLCENMVLDPQRLMYF